MIFAKPFYNAKFAVFRIIKAFSQCHADALRAQKILILLPFFATSSHESSHEKKEIVHMNKSYDLICKIGYHISNIGYLYLADAVEFAAEKS